MRPCLDLRKWTEVTKEWSLPLRCLEPEVEETDVFTLGNGLPSPVEVELWVGPTFSRCWLSASVLCWCPEPCGLLKVTPVVSPEL